MKNKLLILILILILSIPLVACGSDKKAEKSVKETNTVEQVKEEPQVEVNEQPKKEETKEEANKEPKASNLEGSDLVKSISNERPKKMLVKSEMTAFGTTTSMSTYYDGNKSRTEIDVPGMAKSILIHLPDEEVMYQYVYGEENGVKMTGANASYAEEMGLMMDTSMLAEITDASSEDMIARVETLDGEEVIYIEATQSDEDMGDVLVKMWYSKKYATPLKYEIYMGETLMTNLKVIKITDSIRFSGGEFVPPDDVTFQEADMQSMMADW